MSSFFLVILKVSDYHIPVLCLRRKSTHPSGVELVTLNTPKYHLLVSLFRTCLFWLKLLCYALNHQIITFTFLFFSLFLITFWIGRLNTNRWGWNWCREKSLWDLVGLLAKCSFDWRKYKPLFLGVVIRHFSEHFGKLFSTHILIDIHSNIPYLIMRSFIEISSIQYLMTFFIFSSFFFNKKRYWFLRETYLTHSNISIVCVNMTSIICKKTKKSYFDGSKSKPQLFLEITFVGEKSRLLFPYRTCIVFEWSSSTKRDHEN